MSGGVVTASLLPARHVTRGQDEARLQHAVMQYLAWALPPDAVAHHSPGEGKRGVRARADLKRSGFQSGWPDVEVVHKGRVHFIELKIPKGQVSPAQRTMANKLKYCGAPVCLCRRLEDVYEVLVASGVPLRAVPA